MNAAITREQSELQVQPGSTDVDACTMLFLRMNELVQGQLASFICWSEPCSLLSERQLSNGSPWVQDWREGQPVSTSVDL